MAKSTQQTMTKKTAETANRRKSRGICYFLLNLLEDESYPHVQWTNKKKGEFHIHWMHASSGAWEMNTDAETFRLWAKAKGKLEGREGKYKTWKANFRCAMKSRHELQEIQLPKDSPHKKKNLKLWKFIDIELVNRHKDGECFDWRRPRTKSSSWKSVHDTVCVQTLKTKQNKKTGKTKKEIESEESQSSRPRSDSYVSDEQQSSDIEENDNSYGAGLLQIIDRDAENTDSIVPNMPLDERLHIDMEDDSNFNSYGAGLLQIVEQGAENKVSVVPNRTPISLGDRLAVLPPEFSNLSQKEIMLLAKDSKLFGNVYLERKFKAESITTSYFDIANKHLTDGEDPFLCESSYTEL